MEYRPSCFGGHITKEGIHADLLSMKQVGMGGDSSAWASLFDSPPDHVKPQTWWHWVNGHVTKEGITMDLEAMKAAGIQGFYQFFARSGTIQPTPEVKVVFDTDEYWELVKHTLSEASRLGLTAVYSKEFDVSADWVTRYGKRAVLEFDQVEVIAEVELNGIELGSVWTPPYRLQMGKALKAGKNTLSVKVANRLVNRMIGDEHLPADTEYTSDGRLVSWPEWFVKGDPRPTKRVTLGGDRPWKKEDPLLPSGLIGEVRIRTADYPK
jgi:hypothetical protein